MTIPSDFPWQSDPIALAGAQPKISVRLIDGNYVSGYSAEERMTRYEICADLVTQLIAYYHRKMTQPPNRSREELLSRIKEALEQKGWGLSTAEIAWCMGRVADAGISE
ncbi:hypothetical protein ACTJKQ_04035 [Acidovorax sp. 22279]|uniref:hypothetical protein n=1 Tax=Acidovorax sp. 22279 TaxID=3453900 RepID=UPI003F85B85E